MLPDISLVIADDHEIYRDGLALMLSKQPHLKLYGQAGNGAELIDTAVTTKPDIILTDIKMPVMDGLEAARRLKQLLPATRIIALSMYDEENLIVEMLEAGAKGYLLKNADKQEILESITDVFLDKLYYCKATSAKLAGLIAKSSFSGRKIEKVSFTDKEREVIKFICLQHTAQQIGDQMFLSRRTVEGYRTRILEKMNVKNSAGVVIYALKHDIIAESELL